jgi:hypothetical protein
MPGKHWRAPIARPSKRARGFNVLVRAIAIVEDVTNGVFDRVISGGINDVISGVMNGGTRGDALAIADWRVTIDGLMIVN